MMATALKLPSYLGDEQVMKIMHTHDAFRGAVSEGVEPIAPSLRHLQPAHLMTEQEFLEELDKIVPKIRVGREMVRQRVVTAHVAAQIYMLRWQYENREATSVSRPRYTTSTLRDHVRYGRLHALTAEEEQAVFGQRFPRMNWFWLKDVLAIELGRWPQSRRFKSKLPKGKPGRPKGAKAKARKAS
jgi:hypothetical protein